MDCKNILQKGDMAKYAVYIDNDQFDMIGDSFSVELKWGMMGNSITIDSTDMIMGDDFRRYFSFDTTPMYGRVTAICTYNLPDLDSPSGFRIEKDIQYLCFITSSPLPRFACVPGANKQCEHEVKYEHVGQSDVASHYEYLVTSRNDFIITDDDEFILVRKTKNP